MPSISILGCWDNNHCLQKYWKESLPISSILRFPPEVFQIPLLSGKFGLFRCLENMNFVRTFLIETSKLIFSQDNSKVVVNSHHHPHPPPPTQTFCPVPGTVKHWNSVYSLRINQFVKQIFATNNATIKGVRKKNLTGYVHRYFELQTT